MQKIIALCSLLALQLVLTIGVANEFDDYVMMFAIASVSFVSQIYFLLKAKQATGIVILISLIGLLHIFALFAFADAGASVISNNWPADAYYATRAWVVLMLVSVIAMDAAKLGILYRDTLRSFFQRGV